MNPPPAWIIEVENLARGLPVLLVEGKEDEAWLGHFLDVHTPGWRGRRYIRDAGGKRQVIQSITVHRPTWIGIVDRDEWREVDVRAAAAQSSRLHVLPRFCIESYLCDPDELWAALPQQQRDRVGGSVVALAKPIQAALPDWVAHGAMWRVLREIHEVSRFPAKLEEHPVTDEARILVP
jgi:hypothetical protein